LAALRELTRGGAIDRRREAERVEAMVQRLRIKVGAVSDPVATLSGGNQQKVVLAKWLLTEPRIILLNDPTRGIDIGTKQEIYQLLRNLADEGAAILFYSTDYDELIGYQGRIVRDLAGDEITETNIVSAALDLRPAGKTEAAAEA